MHALLLLPLSLLLLRLMLCIVWCCWTMHIVKIQYPFNWQKRTVYSFMFVCLCSRICARVFVCALLPIFNVVSHVCARIHSYTDGIRTINRNIRSQQCILFAYLSPTFGLSHSMSFIYIHIGPFLSWIWIELYTLLNFWEWYNIRTFSFVRVCVYASDDEKQQQRVIQVEVLVYIYKYILTIVVYI